MRLITPILCAAALAALSSGQAFGVQAGDEDKDRPELLKGVMDSLQWRCIGPSRGGRSVAVAGVVGDTRTYYMGATGGGVWKTNDAGASWNNISDDYFKTGSVGAITVAESDPNVIYVGMGECCVRGNFSHGDGVYKSVDAGKTWTHVGLSDSRQIGRILVHPKDHDTVYVAALGHIFGANEERGVFRSTDGGETWEKVLYVDEHAGAVDLAFNPSNPRIIYAAMWQVSRNPWSLSSGGSGSGLYRSTDSGETWTELTNGIPGGVKGKIGVTVSPVNPDRVWAIVEHENGGVFRSDNGGDSFRRVNEDRSLRQRAWYYTHIYADTEEENTVYVLNVGFHKSTDGGVTFNERIRVPHGDNHDLWIDPHDNQRMVQANDGGANVSFDGGESWSRQDNQPTAQFYHVTVDNRFPYRVYGAQQDNSTASISSTNRLGNWMRDFYSVGGGESGYIAVHPENPDIVYAGSYGGYLSRYDHSTRMTRNIQVWPENPMGAGVETMDYRFQWTFPILFSPHDSNVLYTGSQHVHRSTDEGATWEVISPDLTVGDPKTMRSSGGPITQDNTGVEYYATVFTIAESPVERGLIWAGSDDGLIHVTSDSGENWKNVAPPDMGDWPLISLIEASPHDAKTAYAAVNRYKMDDFAPYIYKTTDRGETWDLITDGIAEDAFVRAVREDPEREGLLYAGTETGMWFSLDGGSNWHPLQNELPAVPVTDIAVKENDLVISTQGRSFWIIDDLGPLREMNDEIAAQDVHLFQPAKVYRGGFGSAVTVYYWLADRPTEDLTLAFLDASGEVVREYVTKAPESASSNDGEPGEADANGEIDDEDDEEPARGRRGRAGQRSAPARVGLNTFRWDARYDDAVEVPGAVMWGGSTRGPAVAPGTYTVRLTIGNDAREQPIAIAPDPRVDTSPEEYLAQTAFLLSIRDALSEAHTAINNIRSIRSQVNSVIDRATDHPDAQPLRDAGASLKEQLTAVEEELIQTRSKSSQDPLNFPIKLNNKIAALAGSVSSNYPVTDAVRRVFEKLRGKLDVQLDVLNQIVENDVPAFNELVRELDLPAVHVADDE